MDKVIDFKQKYQEKMIEKGGGIKPDLHKAAPKVKLDHKKIKAQEYYLSSISFVDITSNISPTFIPEDSRRPELVLLSTNREALRFWLTVTERYNEKVVDIIVRKVDRLFRDTKQFMAESELPGDNAQNFNVVLVNLLDLYEVRHDAKYMIILLDTLFLLMTTEDFAIDPVFHRKMTSLVKKVCCYIEKNHPYRTGYQMYTLVGKDHLARLASDIYEACLQV